MVCCDININMNIKIIHNIDETEIDAGKRILCTDDAFSLLFDIKEDIRSYFKHGEQSQKNSEKLLEQISSNIYESDLLDLFV